MVRSNSQNSMTERTFRSPSPNGRNRIASPAPDAPPVPALPKGIPAAQRRSASLDPPMRITSPTPRGGRGASVDRGGYYTASHARVSSLQQVPELEREGSQRSVNFSRPMASPADSPAPSPITRPASSGGWYTSPKVSNNTPRSGGPARPATSQGIRPNELSSIQQNIRSAAAQPVKTKKKAAVANEGKQLAKGTMADGPHGTAVDNTPPKTQAAGSKKTKPTAPPIDTDLPDNPPPRNPARLSPSTESPRSPRTAGMLQKQPSMVREDPEAEDLAERAASPSPAARPMPHISSMKSSKATAPATQHSRSVSLDIPRPGQENGTRGRVTSLSPGRSAHFSDVPVMDNIRHVPPPRSVSPAKGVLKNSPATSLRGPSPNASFSPSAGRGPSISEGSDTTSLASQDGIKPKKKKAVRVSFDDGSTSVAPEPKVSAPPVRQIGDVDDIDEIMKPRPALPLFGSVRGRRDRGQPQDMPEKVTETVTSSMSNSVNTLPDRAESSNDFAIGAVIAQHHAEKAAPKKEQERSPTDPLAPEVTTVEGTGSADESDYSEDDRAATSMNAPSAEKQSDVTPTIELHETEESANGLAPDDVPAINLLPPTPNLEETSIPPLEQPVKAADPPSRTPSQRRQSMPGAWDHSDEEDDEVEENDNTAPTEELEQESLQSTSPSGYVDQHSPMLEPIEETDSDESAAFSDAAEDLSDLEENGYASLDAIVESPIVPPSSGQSISTSPDSPIVQLPSGVKLNLGPSPLGQDDGEGRDGDWNQATAYWSSLSKAKREELEREAAVISSDDERVPVIRKPKKKKQHKPADAQPIDAPPGAIAQMSERVPPKKPAAAAEQTRAPAMRKSMRAQPGPAPASNETHMRKSMRSSGEMRTSMRGADAGANRQAAAYQEPKGTLQKKNIRPATSGNISGTSVPASAIAAATLQSAAAKNAVAPARPSSAMAKMRTPAAADDSDSESSFKKKRRTSISTVDSNTGRYNMRRSMRAGSVDVAADRRPISPTPTPRGGGATRGAGRLSLRSISPSGSMMGRHNQTFRSSLRGAQAETTPTMRGKASKAAARDSKSPTRFSMSGFSRGSKPSGPAPSSTPSSAPAKSSRFKSRFADSDDEDDAPTAAGGRGGGLGRSMGGFRSRFADSDDEDSPIGPVPSHMPADLTPVRGIPRRKGADEDDSTDLDDSEEEPAARKRVAAKPGVPSAADIDAAMAIARRNVAAMNGGRDPGVPETNGKPADGKRVTVADPPPIPQSTSTPAMEAPLTPRKRRGLLGSVLGRRRTSSVASVPTMGALQQGHEPQSPLKAPKLQRRNTPQWAQRTNSGLPLAAAGPNGEDAEAWPLPPPPRIGGTEGGMGAEERPATSDGIEEQAVRLARTMRPDVGRRSQSQIFGDETPVYSEKTGRKKKFGRLRRAFGLSD